jgi:hypothetical protein
VIVCGAARTHAQPADEIFVRYISPLLQEKCLACHGNDPIRKPKGKLDLRSREKILKGGASGQPAMIPGDAEHSPMYLAVIRTHPDWSAMPPKEAERLAPEKVEWLRQWINGGATWPDAKRAEELARVNADRWSAQDGVIVQTSGGLSPQWTNRKYKLDALWAYQPVKMPATKEVGSAAIDELLAARMPAGLSNAPPADRRTLIRRATFDLLGLPPTPEEIDGFVNDPALDDGAFAKVVDRLLASPHYGERMARHWLDVARYADSSGFSNDYERGNAWRYRDYLVRSFNNDKPYDQFAREQLAGDEIDPKNPEMLIATGFLRMGPWELTAMEVPKIARQRFLDDVTNMVGEAFLAQSLQCCRCHDHKFDPIPTRDYYSIQAVFTTTQLAEVPASFLPCENVAGFDEKKFLQVRRDEYLATLRQLDEVLLTNALAWFTEHGKDAAKWDAVVARAKKQNQSRPGKDFVGTFEVARMILTRQGVAEMEFPPKLVGFKPEQYGNERVARKGLERLRWEMERYEPVALAVYDGRTPQVTAISAPVRPPPDRMTAGELGTPCILRGGDPFSPGEKVSPGTLSVLSPVCSVAIPDAVEGRRKAFAQWVSNRKNPLATRAIVNRLWLWHFNQPIAGNPNNFGSTGKRPTHPELLDFLASTLVENGWSIKSMHRLIMNSQAYRRSTEHPDLKLLSEKDPLGISYAAFKPRRLTAEELRDTMLACTGELNLALGGIPNRPEINLEAALQPRQVMGTFAAAWTSNPLPEDRHRRSIYALRLRGLVDPMFEVFNAPATDFSCERRDASTVTPQVFALFNSRDSGQRSIAFAARLLKETQSDGQAIQRCFELGFGRLPTSAEVNLCRSHWRDMEKIESAQTAVRYSPPTQVRRDAVEENTGEKFSFVEKMHANEKFVPDLQAADVDVHTRALADVCLAIFNSNEFVYVY